MVWDALGDGRVVGVFDNEELVKKILAVNPYYYRFYRCVFGQPTTQAIDWLDETQRHELEKVLCRPEPDIEKPVPAEPSGTIRAATSEDVNRMVEIWLQASLKAHNFVSSDFWEQNAIQMRDKYLPAAENYVYCEGTVISGFMSLQKDSLAALFVAPNRQNCGIGRKLLDYAKTLRHNLSLAVYEKNSHSVKFYSHNGFSVIQSQKDPHTGQSELIMQYCGDQRK
ncbi:MAG: GNAT family N-acetyltransferase [Candidatus Riflebacteria bacterium]|nr:GNAT family N-acetyltransferase [Candidatus Riflebacteria bacterium]